MSSCNVCTPRLLCAGALAIGLVAARPGPARAHEPTTSGALAQPKARALLAKFRAIEGLSAHYREEKHMALLAAPLVSEGTVHYMRPGKLARHQTRPEAMSVVLVGDRLQMGGAGERQQVDLRENPVVRMFVTSFLQVLAGDGPALARAYDVQYHDEPAGGWTLTLRPKVEPMARMIERIEVAGRDVVLTAMEIVERGGDRTRMTFSHVDPRHRYDAAEAARVFRLP